jgi:hypothetical protein
MTLIMGMVLAYMGFVTFIVVGQIAIVLLSNIGRK